MTEAEVRLTAADARSPDPWPRRGWVAWLIAAALCLLAYLPTLQNGYIWDDDDYITQNLTLRDADGLRRIWFVPQSIPQYYPLVHTTFWLEYRLWGLHPAGYHAVNILLHATAAFLLGLTLRRLQVPGAPLAAIIFALHPVMVESVAWATERKNVLSAVFYFLGMLALLRFYRLDAHAVASGESESPRRRDYGLGMTYYVLALLSKSVTCSLPAAMLLLIWWKRGRVRLREVASLIPLFAIGLLAGLNTARLERLHVGAEGDAWGFTFLERCLIAGRALWFYAWKLVWPTDLAFIYPRWEIDGGAAWQWVFPLAVAAVIVALLLGRNRFGRGPLVAVLLFAGTLLPALGFFNVYPMRFSFVADHFAYLADAALIALGVAAAVTALARLRPQWLHPAGLYGGAALAIVLALLTAQRTLAYADAKTLWLDTLETNDTCWICHNNVAVIYKQEGDIETAATHLEAGLAIHENYEMYVNLGGIRGDQGRMEEALRLLRRAYELEPHRPTVLLGLSELLTMHIAGHDAEAVKVLGEVLALEPGHILSYVRLCRLHARSSDAAIRDLEKAIAAGEEAAKRTGWQNARALAELAHAYALSGRLSDARYAAGEALRIAREHGDTHTLAQLERDMASWPAAVAE